MADLSWQEAAIRALEMTAEPMHYTDIAEVIAAQELRKSFGATPAASVNTAITLSINNEGEDSPFVRVSKGTYSLRTSSEKNIEENSNQEGGASEEIIEETGLINAFGMYWSREKVLWNSNPAILGQQQAGSTPVNFSTQQGVYLLHDGRDVVYVGRTTDQPLGLRLKQHTVDRLNSRWNRFSWFGVFSVNERGGIDNNHAQNFSLANLIVTMEALFIEGLEPPQNRKRGDDFRAVEFIQVEDPEIEKSQILNLMDELKQKL